MNLFNPASEFYIDGEVVAIFFENAANFYKVLLVKVQDTDLERKDDEIVVTGSFGTIQEGESYHFVGKIVAHPRYGEQFQAQSYTKEKPTTTQGMVHYLASDKFPGIGKITAEKIVDTLGINAVDKILADPDCLKQIPSLNAQKRQMLVETLRLNHGMEQAIMGLSTYGFGTQLAFAIYQTYQEETLEIVRENPYQLVQDIEGIGFTKADNLAEQLGIAADAPQRIKACLIHELLQNSLSTGDTYIEAKDLLARALTTLEQSRPVEIAPNQVAEMILQLVEEGKMQQEGTQLFENSLFFAEWGIATSVERLLKRPQKIKYPKKEIEKALALTEKTLNVTYGPSQRQAILQAIENPLFILTGGPGTGKTTIVQGIVMLFAELNGLSLEMKDYTNAIFPILLAAPTGRAAKRMNETTGLPASTIHRLLGLTGREKNPSAVSKELEGGLLIVDEMSMVDTWLANTLLKAIPTNMQVIFVGDKDQLPSVGPGQVLHDLLAAPKIPHAELTEIYRQEDGSSIISLAHEIREGRLPQDFAKNQKDRSFFPSDAYHIEGLIAQIAKKAQAKGFAPTDIQVLAPMYRGAAGINALNKILQEIFNGNPTGRKKEVQHNNGVYRIGDKVLQLVNTPELNVFNGDMGIITGITYAKESDDKVDELTIEFDGGEVEYKRNEWNKITLSYCCSIHKSQGSEFKMVILPMVHQYQRMLQRNLLYTAITRSKNLLILLGEEQAFYDCVTHQSANRLTKLNQRLQPETLSQEERLSLEAYENGTAVGKKFVEEEASEYVAEKITIKDTDRKENVSTLNADVTANSEGEALQTNLLEDIEEVPADGVWRLTLSNINTIDPMIGMEGLTPAQCQ